MFFLTVGGMALTIAKTMRCVARTVSNRVHAVTDEQIGADKTSRSFA